MDRPVSRAFRLRLKFPRTGLDSRALRRFGIGLRAPKGIVASARWHVVRPLRVTGSRKPTILHDSGDYPAWLDRRNYACNGTPALASDLVALLNGALFEGFHAASLSLRTCLLVGRREEDLRLPDDLTG